METKKRYWLRGGIIALIYSIYWFIIQYLIIERIHNKIINENIIFNILGVLQWPFLIGSFPLWGIFWLGVFLKSELLINISSIGGNNFFAIIVITNILIGALIGYLYGKIKNRGQK